MKKYLLLFGLSSFILGASSSPNLAQTETNQSQVQAINYYQIVVNSNVDGEIIPDEILTIREAIAVVNNTLPVEKLSDREKAQVTPTKEDRSTITFDLDPNNSTIRLQKLLPPIANSTTIDGTTNKAYINNSQNNIDPEIGIFTPTIAITPVDGASLFRGLTITSDRVTIKSLSIYGFNIQPKETATTPPADILIAHRLEAKELDETSHYSNEDILKDSYDRVDRPTKDIVIENNWLGSAPDKNNINTKTRSAFGVSIWNAQNVSVIGNYITNHDSSAIITSVSGSDSTITDNFIVENGKTGMPDAIRLEGIISNTKIVNNRIENNDGGAIYLFKPTGSIEINNNYIKANSRRLRRAAIYLMGDGHKVIDNDISAQKGSGVVVTGFPQFNPDSNATASGNIITNNVFNNIEGLSIDLITCRNIGVQEWQNGDGINPPRNSDNRRLDTGNEAINAPEFFSDRFYIIDGKAVVEGIADPNAQIDFYLVTEDKNYGTLNQPYLSTNADENGKFSLVLTDIEAGSKLSAIATIPEYGTSEPAANTSIEILSKK
jgi:hypothetical protein